VLAADIVRKVIKKTFEKKEGLTPSQWAEKYIKLSSVSAKIAGRYDLDVTPYWRFVYDCYADPKIRKIAIQKSSGIGATVMMANLIAERIVNGNAPVGYIGQSAQKAQEFSEREMFPRMETCKPLNELLPLDKDKIKKKEIQFNNGVWLYIKSAGSARGMAGTPICYVFGDEVDKYEDLSSEGESHPVFLLENRTFGYGDDYKILLGSTPTTKHDSIIHKEFLKGTQHRYFVACPKCKHKQTLRFEQLKWDKFTSGTEENRQYDFEGMKRGTTYECENCNYRISEKEKHKLLDEGEWIIGNTKAPKDFYSFHISAMYSKIRTWGDIAKKFIMSGCGKDVAEYQDLRNNWLGEVWEERAATIHEDDIDKLCDVFPYNRVEPNGELPVKPAAILMAADTQGSSFWYTIAEIGVDKNVYLLDWGECSTFDDLEILRSRTYTYQGDETEVAQCLMDSGGDKTDDVYDFCAASEDRFYPAMGRANTQMFGSHYICSPKIANNGLPYKLYMVNDHTNKNKVLITGLKYKYVLRLPQECKTNAIFKRHLMSHRKVIKGKKDVWEALHLEDHLLDCLKYLLCFYDMRRLEIFEGINPLASTDEEPEKETVEHNNPLTNEWASGGGWSNGSSW